MKTDLLIRLAVIITLIGLVSVSGILLTISATAVGFFMLGSGLIVLGMLIYVVAVVSELRKTKAL